MNRCGGEGDVLARGEYEYLCDGVPVPISESWALSRKAGGFRLSSQREIPALSVVISAHAEVAGGEIKRCVLRWLDVGRKACVAMACYRAGEGCHNDGVYRFRSAGSPSRRIAITGALYFPLLRIFAGQLLGKMMAQDGGEARILVPWIREPAQTEKIFTPEFSGRRVRYLNTEAGEYAGGSLDCFEYSGGRYEDGVIYRLRQGLLREYCWRQGSSEWTVRLKKLEGIWPGEQLWPHAIASSPSTVGTVT